MIKNLVFDIGGVLADFRIKEFLVEKGLDAEQIRRVLKASLKNPYWEKFERGEVTEEEALQAFAKADPEIDGAIRTAFANLDGMLVMKQETIPLLSGLKDAGYRVFYLSNYSKKAYDECGESLAFMPCMDGGIVSFRVGMTKPDPAMYQLFLDLYGLKAEECVFVDDTEENVKVARELGFAGIVYRSHKELKEELEAYGVEVGQEKSR